MLASISFQINQELEVSLLNIYSKATHTYIYMCIYAHAHTHTCIGRRLFKYWGDSRDDSSNDHGGAHTLGGFPTDTMSPEPSQRATKDCDHQCSLGKRLPQARARDNFTKHKMYFCLRPEWCTLQTKPWSTKQSYLSEIHESLCLPSASPHFSVAFRTALLPGSKYQFLP